MAPRKKPTAAAAKKTAAKKPATARKAAAKKPAAKASAPKAAPKPGKVTLDRKAPVGLFGHIWEARRGLRASFEAQLASGVREERLLAYVAFACAMAFVARLPETIRQGQAMPGDNAVLGLVAGSFVAFVIFAPLFLYGVAGLSHFISAWAFGGQGSYIRARLALFWALVLGVPVGLIYAIATQALTTVGATPVLGVLGVLVFLFWLWIWTSFLALSEGFGRLKCYSFTIALFTCIAGIAVLLTQ